MEFTGHLIANQYNVFQYISNINIICINQLVIYLPLFDLTQLMTPLMFLTRHFHGAPGGQNKKQVKRVKLIIEQALISMI